MAKRDWSVQDAKNRFSEVVEAARRAPQTVTKHGKPAVVVVDVMEYERLRRLERAQAPSFADLARQDLANEYSGAENLRFGKRVGVFFASRPSYQYTKIPVFGGRRLVLRMEGPSKNQPYR